MGKGCVAGAAGGTGVRTVGEQKRGSGREWGNFGASRAGSSRWHPGASGSADLWGTHGALAGGADSAIATSAAGPATTGRGSSGSCSSGWAPSLARLTPSPDSSTLLKRSRGSGARRFPRSSSPISAVSFASTVCRGVDRLVAACDRLGVAYNSEFSPLSDLTFALLLTRAAVRWRYAPLEGGICEIVCPAIYGVHLMQVDKHLTTAERRSAMRHGLAHPLDGHLRDLAPAADGGHWETYEEAVADLFALVDLVPDHQLDTLVHAGTAPQELEASVREVTRKYAPEWPEDRLSQRACHRVRMVLSRD